MITYEQANKAFTYKDGILYWNQNRKRVKVGDAVTSKTEKGYVRVTVDGVMCKAHQIIFLLHNKKWPTQVDHINGIRDDNRIENLREVTSKQNNWNRKSINPNGTKGVHWHKQIGRWVASITINRKNIHLGSFVDFESASNKARQAREKLHGEFARGQQ